MFQTFRNAWKIPELKNRLLFTLAILVVYRLGCAIPVPFVSGSALTQMFANGDMLSYLKSFIVTKSYLWFSSYFCCKDKWFARLNLCYIDLRLGNDLKITLSKCFAVMLRDQSVCSVLKEYSLSVHLLDHFSWSFSFTESRDGNSSFCFLVCILHCFF